MGVETAKKSLDGCVIELTRESALSFLPTHRVVDALVVGNNVFCKTEVGPLEVYDLKTGMPVTSFPFEIMELKGMASDGKDLYLQVDWKMMAERRSASVKSGMFDLRDDDILLARVKEWFDAETIASPGQPSQPYRDGSADWIGKPLRELSEREGERVTIENLEGIIVPVPLSWVTQPAVVYDVARLLGREGCQRFLIHEDMSMPHIASGNGFVWGSYNYHFGEGGCDRGFYLWDGAAHQGVIPRKLNALLAPESPWREELHIHATVQHPFGISAYAEYMDEDKLPSCPGPIELEEATETVGVDLRITPTRDAPEKERIAEVRHVGDTVQVLLRQSQSSVDRPGLYRVLEPAQLIMYKVNIFYIPT